MFEVLLVEDSRADADLAREAFAQGVVPVHVSVVDDGEKALKFLLREGSFAAVPVPDLVVLDLNLPRMSGHEVLKSMKSEPRLSHIPVIVMSSSSAPSDVRKSYELHASCHLEKPMEYGRFVRCIEALKDFWLSEVRLPR